jgi:hypothetical protein
LYGTRRGNFQKPGDPADNAHALLVLACGETSGPRARKGGLTARTFRLDFFGPAKKGSDAAFERSCRPALWQKTGGTTASGIRTGCQGCLTPMAPDGTNRKHG